MQPPPCQRCTLSRDFPLTLDKDRNYPKVHSGNFRICGLVGNMSEVKLPTLANLGPV